VVVLGSLGTGTIIGLNVLVSQNLIMEMSEDALKSFFIELKERNLNLLARAKELMRTYGKPIVFVRCSSSGRKTCATWKPGRR
jgi:hypothetical protein